MDIGAVEALEGDAVLADACKAQTEIDDEHALELKEAPWLASVACWLAGTAREMPSMRFAWPLTSQRRSAAEVVVLRGAEAPPPCRGDRPKPRRRWRSGASRSRARWRRARRRRPCRRAFGCDQTIEADDPAAALGQYADQHGFDLLVVGRHGLDRAGTPAAGGVTEYQVRHSRCPVLVVGRE